jgi:protein TonB
MTAKRYLRYLPALGIVAACGIAVLVVYLLMKLLSDKPSPPVRVQQISLLPPPPPPKLEKPPEPEIKKEQQQMDAPKDAPVDSADPVATENTSGNGPRIAFGKARAGIGEPFGGYSAALKADIRDWLGQDKKLRRSNYLVELRLWIASNGRIERAEMVTATGDTELDQRLRAAIAGFVGKTREAPPHEMPQPIRLAVRTR